MSFLIQVVISARKLSAETAIVFGAINKFKKLSKRILNPQMNLSNHSMALRTLLAETMQGYVFFKYFPPAQYLVR